MRTATRSTFSYCEPTEYTWIATGRTFCIKRQGNEKYVSTGGPYWLAELQEPKRPLVSVGDIGRADSAPDLPFIEPADYSPRRLSCEKLLIAGLLAAAWGVFLNGVWRVWR